MTNTTITFTADKDTKSGKRFTTAATPDSEQTPGYSGSVYLTTEFMEANHIGDSIVCYLDEESEFGPVLFTQDKTTKSGFRYTTAATPENDQTTGVTGSVYVTGEAQPKLAVYIGL